MKYLYYIRVTLAAVATLTLTIVSNAQQWQPEVGPSGAAYRDLVASTVNNNILYAAIANVGVAATTDGGFNWKIYAVPVKGRYDNMQLEIVPSTTTHLRLRVDSVWMESYNGGNAWSINPSPTTFPLVSMYTHPKFPNIVYLGAKEDGLFRTTNYGATWERVWTFGTPTIIKTSPKDPAVLAITIGSELYRSLDTGATWRYWSSLPAGGDITAMEFDLLSENRLYVAQNNKLFLSTNQGLNWKEVTTNAPNATVIDFIQDISIPSSVWAYGSRLFVSTDVGNTWNVLDSSNTPYRAVAKFKNRMFAACDNDHIWESTNTGVKWGWVDKDIRAWEIHDINMGASNDWIVVGRNNISVSRNFGRIWKDSEGASFSPTYDGRIGAFAVAPSKTSRWYVYTPEGFAVSNNRGDTWDSRRTLIGESVTSIAVAPKNYDIVYAATQSGIVVSTDGAVSWNTVQQPPGIQGVYTGLACGTTGSGIIAFGGNNSSISTSLDGGQTWQTASIPTVASAAMFIGTTSNILVAGNGVYLSTNDGYSYQRISNVDSVVAITSNPLHPNNIHFVTLHGKLYEIPDISNPSNIRLRHAAVNTAYLSTTALSQSAEGIVYMGTERGLYRFNPTPVSVEEQEKTTGLRVTITTNPAEDILRFTVLHTSTVAQYQLVNVVGNIVLSGSCLEQENSLNITSLAVGMYCLVVYNENNRISMPVILRK